MCTAINFNRSYHLFGRTLDNECEYGEEPCIVSQDAARTLGYRSISHAENRVLGMASRIGGAPYFFDGFNDKGLCVAGLNLPVSTRLSDKASAPDTIPSQELVYHLLATASTTDDVRCILKDKSVTSDPPAPNIPSPTLHYLIADSKGAITVEITAAGINVYDNPVGVLTNEPTFPYHTDNLLQYSTLSPSTNDGRSHHTAGLGAIGLPGDFTSASRFVRAAFLGENATDHKSSEKAVANAFTILGAISIPEGAVITPRGFMSTRYTAVLDPTAGTYYLRRADSLTTMSVTFEASGDSDKPKFISVS